MKHTKILGHNYITLFVLMFILNYNASFAGVNSDTTITKKNDMHQHKGMDMNTNVKQHGTENASVIRKGTINLKAIDLNKDGKVYQDQMHWNVISDKPGKCPLCNMTLKEVTMKEAKANLKANKYKVK